jgi:monoamine oxidase
VGNRDRRATDVVVIGAGLSGLIAARAVRAAGLGVCVLEARDRAGGRLEPVAGPDGEAYDAGGQFLGKTQVRVFELVDALGLAHSPASTAGRFVRVRDGRRSALDGAGFDDPAAGEQYDGALRRLVAMAGELDADTPWTHPRAGEWDSETFRTWTEANIASADARRAVEGDLMPTGPPTDVSLFRVVAFVRAVGDREDLLTTEHGLIHGGTFQIGDRLAAQLADAIVLETPVRAIAQGPTGVEVVADRVEVHAGAAIVALAPPLVERIDFSPELPARRRLLQQRWAQMPSIKSIAVYEMPWWRERGFSGNAATDLPVAPYINDASPPGDGRGVLVSFTNLSLRPPAWVIDDEARRRAQFLATVDAAFGPSAPAPLAYLEGNWFGRRWARGCGNLLAPGVLSQLGDALRAPAGRVLWAGTEASMRWPGFMEGAILAGEDAAARAIALAG